MGSTHTNILLHIVFSTKERAPMIQDELRDRLYRFMGGAIRSNQGVLHAIGGTTDHVHLLVGWNATGTIARLLQDIKGGSSRWVHETFPGHSSFAWQTGYAAFSVSQSQSGRVRRYIENQEEHHRKHSFKDELQQLLKAHGIDFDERYLWE